MNQLPQTQKPQVLRTDFSNQSAWEKACNGIQKPYGDHYVGVEFIDKLEYKDIDKKQVLKLIPDDYNHNFIMIFDHFAAETPDCPLLIVDLSEEPGREFRADPSQVFGIESNLETSNLFFSEFADFVDEEGNYSRYPLGMEDLEPQLDETTIASILSSSLVSSPTKKRGIRYWITRILLNSHKKRLQK